MRDALERGPSAPQRSIAAFRWINAGARQDEDCLYLNVWTPAADHARRPVLLWLHGGGFLVGSGSTPLYNGARLARRGDAVVVTINYRLGAIGFSNLSTLFPRELPDSSNLGVRDQIAALEWVRENIARFGGDPNNVTVFGQSAGGMSVGALLGAPRARALFHRAICMSGAADHVLSRGAAEAVAERLFHNLGGASLSHALLGRIPMSALLAAQHQTMLELADLNTLMCFLPSVDGELIPEQPLDAIADGAAAHIPILTGATLEEWKLFGLLDSGAFTETLLGERFEMALRAFPEAPPLATAIAQYRRALGDRRAADSARWVWQAFQSARVFHHPSTRLAEAQHAGGGAAYSYLVTWRAPAVPRVLGACHAIDIPFVFGLTAHPLMLPLAGLSPRAGRLSRRMMDAWANFARTGEPGHARLPHWPSYTPDERATMMLGRRCLLAEAPLEAERALLENWAHETPHWRRHPRPRAGDAGDAGGAGGARATMAG